MSPYLQQGDDSWNGFVMQSWTVGIRKDTKDSGQDPRRKDFGYQQNEKLISKTIIMGQQKFMAKDLHSFHSSIQNSFIFAPAPTWILVPGFILLA